jgi:hypothetical protein
MKTKQSVFGLGYKRVNTVKAGVRTPAFFCSFPVCAPMKSSTGVHPGERISPHQSSFPERTLG